jgi:DNA-binding transcriptional ArsR family regulator
MADTAKQNGVCKTMFVHEETVKAVMESMPREEQLYELADFFKIVGDTTRIKILHALLVAEMCVCDLSNLLNVSQSAVSHQLRTLRQADLVTFRKQGKVVFYSLKDEHIRQIINFGLQHAMER